MSVTLYSTGCPRCKVLKSKLDNKLIQYDVISDEDEIIDSGVTSVPSLRIDNKLLDFSKSIKLVNEYDGTNNFESFVNSIN